MPSFLLEGVHADEPNLLDINADIFDFAPLSPSSEFSRDSVSREENPTGERTLIAFDDDNYDFQHSLGLLNFEADDDLKVVTKKSPPVKSSARRSRDGKKASKGFDMSSEVSSNTTSEEGTSTTEIKRKRLKNKQDILPKRRKYSPQEEIRDKPKIFALNRTNLAASNGEHQSRAPTYSSRASCIERANIMERQQQQSAEEKLTSLVALLRERSNLPSSSLLKSAEATGFGKSSIVSAEDKILSVVKLLKAIQQKSSPTFVSGASKATAAFPLHFDNGGNGSKGGTDDSLFRAISNAEGFLRHILIPSEPKLPEMLLRFSSPHCVLNCRSLSSIATAAAEKLRMQNRVAKTPILRRPLCTFDFHDGVGQINVAAREFSMSISELLSSPTITNTIISVNLDHERVIFSPNRSKLSAPFSWVLHDLREKLIPFELKFNGLIHCLLSESGIIHCNISFDSSPLLRNIDKGMMTSSSMANVVTVLQVDKEKDGPPC